MAATPALRATAARDSFDFRVCCPPRMACQTTLTRQTGRAGTCSSSPPPLPAHEVRMPPRLSVATAFSPIGSRCACFSVCVAGQAGHVISFVSSCCHV